MELSHSGRNVRRQIVSSVTGRALTFPVQLACSAATSYLTIRFAGLDVFAFVGLIAGLQGFFSFLNLGSNAPLASAAGVVHLDGHHNDLQQTLQSAVRATLATSGVCIILVICMTALSVWGWILGKDVPAGPLRDFGPLIVVAGAAATQLLSLAIVILTNTGRVLSAVIVSSSSAVFTLICTLGVVYVGGGPLLYVVAVVVGPVFANAIATILVSRWYDITLRKVMIIALDLRQRLRPILRSALPALSMWVFLPIAYQSDRIIVSHRSSVEELAKYNLAGQFYTPLFALVGVSSSMLWGYYAARRVTDSLPTRREFTRLSLAFLTFGSVLGVAYVVTMMLIDEPISEGSVSLDLGLILLFAMLLVVQAFHQPSAMLQTDVRGLRWNSGAVAVMTLVNLALSWMWAAKFGASGPVGASLASVTILLAAPSFCRALSVLRKTDLGEGGA